MMTQSGDGYPEYDNTHGTRWSQVGIAIILLGIVVALMGLYPSLTGVETNSGFGVLQILTVLGGFAILILGAFVFVQAVFYPGHIHTLAQKIGVRLSMTGLLGAAAAGLADVLGFGSNNPALGEIRPTLGVYQAIGIIGGFFIAAIGILIFVLTGERNELDEETD